MLGVIVNPNALGVRRDPALADRLRAVLGDDGEVVATRTPAELPEAVARFAARGYDPIGICGGDGSNLSTISQLVAHAERLGPGQAAGRLPRFAILRGGTVNTVAGNLGIRGRPEELLARLVARLRAGRPLDEVEQDLLCVNGMYGFLFAAAMGARFLEAYYGAPVQGVAAAVVLATRTIASSLVQGSYARWLFQPVPMRLTADGEELPLDRARLLLASTVPDVGIGNRVTWQAGRVPGRFHLVASNLPTTSMALQIHRVRLGRPLEGGPQEAHLAHVDRLARSLHIRFEAAQPFTLDGDLFRAEQVTIAIGPRIRVVIPTP